MDNMARAPNYLKDANFVCIQSDNGKMVWIHSVMLPVYDVKAMSPEDMGILVPQEAELGNVYDKEDPKRDDAFQAERLVKCQKEDGTMEYLKKLMHPKLTAHDALLNWFPVVCAAQMQLTSRQTICRQNSSWDQMAYAFSLRIRQMSRTISQSPSRKQTMSRELTRETCCRTSSLTCQRHRSG